MKLIKLSILILILSTGTYTYSQVPLKPLYELFTSSTCGPCVGANEILDEIFENNPDEYSSVKYQMDWPGNGDPYYTQEGGIRQNYYGVNSVPNLYINSEEFYPAQSMTQEIFDAYAALTTSMEIEITEAFIDDDNLISVDVEISSLANYEAGLIAHIVVVEKRTFNNVGTNGETEFRDVMMKMLPDAFGTELDALAIGEIITLNETFDMDETNMETPNDLAVIVFVQNNSDKSVIQSEMIDVEGVFEVYNITYVVEDAFGNPIEGAEVLLENNGTLSSDVNGQLQFEEILTGTYEYLVSYPGLIHHSGSVNLIDEDIIQFITLEHYTSLQETFNSGLPSNWTKHVADGNYLFHFLGKVKFARFNENEDLVMLLSPAVEIYSTDTLSFEYGDVYNEPILSFGVISDPQDPETFTEIEILYPQDEWESFELALNSLTSTDTVIYFAWKLQSVAETSFHLDNVFIHKEGEVCLPIYAYGCEYYGMGFTDFAFEQIENYGSNCGDLNGTGYSQYFEMGPAEVLEGEIYNLTIATGHENVYATIWIDFNDDFVFTTNEMVIDNFLMEQPGNLYDVELMIPSATADGLYLMRARTNGDGLCNDPCEEYYYGEAEDYLIQVGEELILPPTNLNYELAGGDIVLEWDAPNVKELIGYNLYHSHEMGTYEILANLNGTTFTHESPMHGLHNYYVTALYNTGESDPTNTIEVLLTGTMNQYENEFQIYPNPASDIVNVKSELEIKSFKIFNHSGQVVLEKIVKNKTYQFNVSKFVSGLYFFLVETTEGTFNQRIIIQ